MTLFQSNLVTEQQMKVFVAVSFSTAILDSGASATVTGITWLKCYLDTLPIEERENVKYTKSSNTL